MEKTKIKYEESDSIYCGIIQGDGNELDDTIKRLPIVVEKNKRWPWLAALFNQNVYRCTAVMLSRSIAIVAAHCLDQTETLSDIRLELYNRKSKLNFFFSINSFLVLLGFHVKLLVILKIFLDLLYVPEKVLQMSLATSEVVQVFGGFL